MAKLKIINVTQWKKEIYKHTSGRRTKYIFYSPKPKSEKYYFKMSLRETKKDYKFEFWSEIIASKVGKLLGFNVVDYNVAYNQTEIGCMSQSIINKENEDLSDGYGFIVEKYPDFKVNFKKTHSFQKIIGALKNIHLEHCQKAVLEMIVFDTIIGNTDRHSENWGIVITNRLLDDRLKILNMWEKIKLKITIYVRTKGKISFQKIIKRYKEENWKFSPLYDNGSSLGRELSEEKIINLLNNEDEFDKFIHKGKPDIRWNDKNLNYFDLIDVLLLDYKDEVKQIIENMRNRYNKKVNEIVILINNIDNRIPTKFNEYKLSDNRKKFIIRNINKRINFLINKSNEQVQ
jgi:hypothetical protein